VYRWAVGPLGLLLSGLSVTGSFPVVKQLRHEADIHTHLAPRFRMSGVTP
jgi:hypothetical protein